MTTVSFVADTAARFGFQDTTGAIYAGGARYRANDVGEWDTVCIPAVNIPSGAVINSATLNIYVDLASMDEPNHDIDAEDVAGATCPAGGDANSSISNRTGTTAVVNWTNAGLGAPGFFDTPDLSTIIQELVDTYGGLNGDVLFRFKANSGGDLGIATPAGDPSWVATLTVDYTESGGSTSVTVSDSAAGTDTVGQLTATANVPETGAGADIIGQLSASFAVSDSGAASDMLQNILNILHLADNGEANDILSSVLNVLRLADNAAGADALASVLNTIRVDDSGAGVDTDTPPNVTVAVTDMGTGMSIITVETILTLSDFAAGIEVISAFDAGGLKTVTDSATGAEAIIVNQRTIVNDTGAGFDFLNILVSVPPITDSGNALDTIIPPVVRAIIADYFQSSETLSVTAAMTLSDDGTAIESVTAQVQGAGGGILVVTITYNARRGIIRENNRVQTVNYLPRKITIKH